MAEHNQAVPPQWDQAADCQLMVMVSQNGKLHFGKVNDWPAVRDAMANVNLPFTIEQLQKRWVETCQPAIRAAREAAGPGDEEGQEAAKLREKFLAKKDDFPLEPKYNREEDIAQAKARGEEIVLLEPKTYDPTKEQKVQECEASADGQRLLETIVAELAALRRQPVLRLRAAQVDSSTLCRTCTTLKRLAAASDGDLEAIVDPEVGKTPCNTPITEEDGYVVV